MKVRIGDIQIGERRREDLGDLTDLCASLSRYGLIHPVVIRADRTLVAGGRRLAAAQLLDWPEIEVRDLGELSDDELHAIELEENVRRKPLTNFEEAKAFVGHIERVKEELREEAKEEWGFLPETSKNPKGGRPKKPDKEEAVAARIGVARQTVNNAVRHVETAEKIVALKDAPQYQVLEARTHLDTLPAAERAQAVALVNQPGIPAGDALAMLGNLAAMPEPERVRLYTLDASSDPRDRQRAVTEAARQPPMPDPRIAALRKLAAQAERLARDFPPDRATPLILAVAVAARQAITVIKEDA